MQYWWVNQSIRYRIERTLSHMYAPIYDRAGRRPVFYENMTRLTPGDLVVHYTKGLIPSLSIVQSHAIEVPRPHLPDETEAERGVDGLDRPGRLVDTKYYDFVSPVEKTEFAELCIPELGPFQTGKFTGRPKLGYLWPLEKEFVEALRSAHSTFWPAGVQL